MGPYQDLRQLVFVATVGPFKIIGSLPQQLEWPIQDDGKHISVAIMGPCRTIGSFFL